jgi:hypothetical protein
MSKNYTEKSCLVKEDRDLFRSYKIILDKDNKSTNWHKSNDDYCEYCNRVYKSKCDDAASKINSRVFNDNSKEASKTLYLDKINTHCKNIMSNVNKNSSDDTISISKRDSKLMYNKLKTCMDFRIGQHSNCVRYVGNDVDQKIFALENKGDITHKPFIDKLDNTLNNCLTTYQYLKKLKPVRSRTYLSKEQDKIKFKNFKSKYNIKIKRKSYLYQKLSKKSRSNKNKNQNKKKKKRSY